MTDHVSLLKIIERIYGAAADPSTFPDLMPSLARDFRSEFSSLYLVQEPGVRSADLMLSATPHFDDWVHTSYTGYYRARDIWGLAYIKGTPKGGTRVAHGFEAVDEQVVLRSEIYDGWHRKAGIHHALAGVFPVDSDTAFLSLTRPRREPEFDERDRQRLAILLPHIQRASQIHQRLILAEQQRGLTLEVMERLSLGIIIVEADAVILFANSVARRLLHAGQELTLVQRRLQARQKPRRGDLETTIRQAAWTSIGQGTSPGGMVIIPRLEGLPLSLLIAPYRAPPGSDGYSHGAALIMFADPAAETQAPEKVIAQMLGLSPAEGRLVSALVGGESPSDYAERAGLSRNTIKTQLRQVFNKTGYNRQADIVRAVAAHPLVKLVSDAPGDDSQ